MPNRSIREICERASAAYGISVDEICENCATPEIRRARNIAIYIARQTTYRPLFVIAKHFKGESVRSVIAICNEVRSAIQKDGAAKDEVEKIFGLCRKQPELSHAKPSCLPKPKIARYTTNASVPVRTKNGMRRRRVAIEPIQRATESATQNTVALSFNASEARFENDQRSAMSVPAEARWWISWCRYNAKGRGKGPNVERFSMFAERARKDIGYDPRLRTGEYNSNRGLQKSLDERDKILNCFNALVEQELRDR